jgi:cation:H+ antiporter
MLFIWIIVFILSFYVLIKASDYFTDSAEKIGLYFGLPAFIIGVTIVSIGTSLPELFTSIIAVFQGHSEMVIGNVVGSNITNICLVLGVVALLARKKIKLGYNLLSVDLPILIGSAFLLGLMVWDGNFTAIEGVICLVAFIIYVAYTITAEKKDKQIQKDLKSELKKKEKFHWKNAWILILSAVAIYFGAKYVVESVIQISSVFSIGTEIIALSAVALGTSLPELVVSVVAARKGKPELAIGNILGSNIFNTFAVMGVPALFGVLIIPQTILSFAIPLMIITTLLYFFITQDKEITKWEGLLMLIFYVVFIGKLFNLF